MCTVNTSPTLRIDLTSSVAAYRQIVDGLRIFLVNGELEAGTVLPSVRRMAVDLGVHHNTVAEAYRTLAEEGWLDLRHGRAAIVQQRSARRGNNAGQVQEFRNRMRALIAEMRSQGASAAKLRVELEVLAEELKS